MAASRQTWPIAKLDSCLTATVGQLDLPDLPDRPYNPDVKVVFPNCTFGHKKQVFCRAQHHWFTKWPFLHYDQGKDVVFCHTCVNAFKLGRILWSKNASTAFSALYVILTSVLWVPIYKFKCNLLFCYRFDCVSNQRFL